MDLPDFPDLSSERLAAVLTRHDLGGERLVRMPETGIFNAIFAVGEDLVLRVPRQHPAFVDAARKEAVAVPTARTVGVRTPRLVAFDDSLEVLTVPYGLYERVPGRTLESTGSDPVDAAAAYRELGRDLAVLHARVERSAELADLRLEELPPPEAWPAELVAEGYLGESDERWLRRWMSGVDAQADDGSATPPVFRHGDVQASNVMVAGDGRFRALLDWGACGWGEAAHDFAGVPCDAVPSMLAGYRAEIDVPTDGSFEARIVKRQLHIALFLLRRPPQPGRSWAERPLGMIMDLMRFLGRTSDDRFARIRP